MSIEKQVLGMATMASNAFGWKSEMSGMIGTAHSAGEGYNCKDEDEYVLEVLSYLGDLDQHFESIDWEHKMEGKSSALNFVKQSKACNLIELEKLVREDWKELLEVNN